MPDKRIIRLHRLTLVISQTILKRTHTYAVERNLRHIHPLPYPAFRTRMLT